MSSRPRRRITSQVVDEVDTPDFVGQVRWTAWEVDDPPTLETLWYALLNTTTAIEREDWQDARLHAECNRRLLGYREAPDAS